MEVAMKLALFVMSFLTGAGLTCAAYAAAYPL